MEKIPSCGSNTAIMNGTMQTSRFQGMFNLKVDMYEHLRWFFWHDYPQKGDLLLVKN